MAALLAEVVGLHWRQGHLSLQIMPSISGTQALHARCPNTKSNCTVALLMMGHCPSVLLEVTELITAPHVGTGQLQPRSRRTTLPKCNKSIILLTPEIVFQATVSSAKQAVGPPLQEH